MAELLQEGWMKGVAVTTTVLAVCASIAGSRSTVLDQLAEASSPGGPGPGSSTWASASISVITKSDAA